MVDLKKMKNVDITALLNKKFNDSKLKGIVAVAEKGSKLKEKPDKTLVESVSDLVEAVNEYDALLHLSPKEKQQWTEVRRQQVLMERSPTTVEVGNYLSLIIVAVFVLRNAKAKVIAALS